LSEKEIRKRVNLLSELLAYEKSKAKLHINKERHREEVEVDKHKKKCKPDIDMLFSTQLKSYYASSEL
jgi:hypothetical protein